MVKVLYIYQIKKYMKENLKMVWKMVKVNTLIQMEIIMRDNGIMEKDMEEVFMYGYIIKKHKIKKYMMVNLNLIWCMVEVS